MFCALIVLAAVIFLPLSGFAADRLTLLSSERFALDDYNRAFILNSTESPNDYITEVHYKICSYGNIERLKAAWMRTGYPRVYGPWNEKAWGAIFVSSKITGGLPEIWGVLHKTVGIDLKHYDKPHITLIWHEEWHVRADDDLRLLYPDSDPGNVKIVADPRQTDGGPTGGKMEGAR
jgi:hypothetical protein